MDGRERPQDARGMRGTATTLVPRAPDAWHCHAFRAIFVGYVALPSIWRRVESMRVVRHEGLPCTRATERVFDLVSGTISNGGGDPIAASHAILNSNGAPLTRAASFLF